MEPTNPSLKPEVWAQGFIDGVRFVSIQLRAAADKVERPTRGTVQYTRNEEKRSIEAIVRAGQPHFARTLRELAQVIEAEANAFTSKSPVVGVHKTPPNR